MIIIPILQTRKLRPREIKYFAQGHLKLVSADSRAKGVNHCAMRPALDLRVLSKIWVNRKGPMYTEGGKQLKQRH